MAIDQPLVTHATREDVPEILLMIREHADYENSRPSCLTTEASLLDTLSFSPFPPTPKPGSAPTTTGYARALLVRTSPHSPPAGLAVYVTNYSTWRGRPGIYLDDLYVRQQYRKKGLGRLLIQRVAQEVLSIDGCRLEWVCGAGNTASRDWYKALGAREMGEWIPLRLEWEALEEVARGEGNRGRGEGVGVKGGC